MTTLQYIFLLTVTCLCVSCRSNAEPTNDTPMPIIVLLDQYNKPATEVMLKIDYGMIISNGDTSKKPDYYLFFRKQKRTVKTQNFDKFLSEIKEIPDNSMIDMIGKCTVGFYTPYGVDIEKEYSQTMELLKKKNCILVESMEQDERHAMFCYCLQDFEILEE